jgi:hypothetical protein
MPVIGIFKLIAKHYKNMMPHCSPKFLRDNILILKNHLLPLLSMIFARH